MKRIAAIVIAIIAIAFMSWFGTKQYRKRLEQRKHAIGCERRNAEFARRVEATKRDANEELTIGTKKAASWCGFC